MNDSRRQFLSSAGSLSLLSLMAASGLLGPDAAAAAQWNKAAFESKNFDDAVKTMQLIEDIRRTSI